MTVDPKEFVEGQTEKGQPVQEVLKTLADELRGLNQQRKDLVKRIDIVKGVIVGLSRILGADLSDDQLEDVFGRKVGRLNHGLTNVCRRILSEAREPLRARDMRDRVLEDYCDLLQPHKQPIASIVTVLNRLVTYGEERIVNIENQRAWVKTGEALVNGE